MRPKEVKFQKPRPTLCPFSKDRPAPCFIVRDHNGHALDYLYFEEEPGRCAAANKDEAQRCGPATFLAPVR